jgi:hypothetical protein
MPQKNVALDIVNAVIKELRSRNRFDCAWNLTDKEIQQEIIFELEEIVHEKLGTERQPLGCIPENKSRTIIRYYRPKSLAKVHESAVMTDHNLGGICLAFEIYHDIQMLAVGWAIFGEKENFNKSDAAARATAMISKSSNTDTICIRYRSEISLVDNLRDAVWGALSGQNDYLINELNAHTRGNIQRLGHALHSVELNRT